MSLNSWAIALNLGNLGDVFSTINFARLGYGQYELNPLMNAAIREGILSPAFIFMMIIKVLAVCVISLWLVNVIKHGRYAKGDLSRKDKNRKGRLFTFKMLKGMTIALWLITINNVIPL